MVALVPEFRFFLVILESEASVVMLSISFWFAFDPSTRNVEIVLFLFGFQVLVVSVGINVGCNRYDVTAPVEPDGHVADLKHEV